MFFSEFPGLGEWFTGQFRDQCGRVEMYRAQKKSSGVAEVNRSELELLARDRIRDAEVLLANGQWPGAYYMAGYALEFALKVSTLKHIDDTGKIFRDRKYLEKLAKCWTHDLNDLLTLADLRIELDKACGTNSSLQRHWAIAKDWNETSRYEQKTEQEARELFGAITNIPDGVLTWIRSRW